MPKVKKLVADQLNINIYETRTEMGKAAAEAVSVVINRIIAKSGSVNVVFAAAPSQNELLATLASNDDIDWAKVNAFHLDEYLGLPKGAPQRFGKFLEERLFDKVSPGRVELFDGTATDSILEAERYSNLITKFPIDIACIGIGENGHIAFNDPDVADFNDPKTVKCVELDAISRQQQVNDGCFGRLEDVPTQALTLTIPAIMSAGWIHCVVPGESKSDAVEKTIRGDIKTTCPASILRRHKQAILYIDKAAATKVL